MAAINETFVDIEITVSGVTRYCEARVSYIHSPAFAAIVERGSGIPISPPEPENAEIQRILIDGGEADFQGKRKQHDILHLLTDGQVDAIVNEILGG